MHIYIVYAHPSDRSFTREVLDAFVHGLEEAGHTYEIGDLYRMNFVTDMDIEQYERETGRDPDAPIPADVAIEHGKIGRADALAFVYPVWWSDCPAKLKGWFERVLVYGYAYLYDDDEARLTKIDIEKALVICPAGHDEFDLEETGIARSMRTVMLHDRLLGVGVRSADMVILGGMTEDDGTNRRINLRRAFELGRKF